MSNEQAAVKPSIAKNKAAPRRAPGGKAVGMIVLLAGIVAFLGMGYAGYQKFYQEAPVSDSPVTEENTQVPSEANTVAADVPVFGKNIPSGTAIAGTWRADFASGSRAFLQLKNDAFQLIYTQDAEGRYRKYSRGTYTYDAKEGVLYLMPNRDFGAPPDTEGVQYSILTLRKYYVRLARDAKSGDIFWAPRDANASGQVHPLFLSTRTDQSAIRWVKGGA